MKSPHKGLVTALAMSALIVFPLTGGRLTRVVDRSGQVPTATYSPHEKEFWLAEDVSEWVRPGLNVTVNSITNVAPGQKPVVDVSFTDDLGQPLDRNGAVTPGEIQAYFIIAHWNADTRAYHNYTAIPFGPGQPPTPLHDVGGTWEDVAVGHSIYTFGLSMPSDFDVTQTATLGIYSDRDLESIIGKNYNAPAVVKYFRPDGGTPSDEKFDALDTAACNTCHNPLSMHEQFGPPIQEVKVCVMCHTPEFPPTQTGESLNFKVFIHKLHRGESLPSVEAGTPYKLGDADFSTVTFPQDIRNCATCHVGQDASHAPSQSNVWYTYPSSAACGSCHDDVNFTTGENHPAGPVTDSQCSSCHIPQGDREWDASVIGAHTVPFKSTQLKGVKANIVSVTNTAPGQNPTIVFNLTQNDGTPIAPSAFTTVNSDGTTSSGLNVLMSGPTTDYALPPQIRERADGATASGSNYTYTFTNAIPSDSTGTWGFSVEARLTVTLNPAPHDTTSVKDAAFNPVFYAAVTDTEAKPRRVVVDIDKCNACHDRLAFHGSNRLNPQECVFCHNPNGHDKSTPAESIDFKRMIHRIHTGEDLTQDYTIGDTSFNDVRFPGDRRDCQKCHTTDASGSGTEQVSENPPPGLLATDTPKDWYSPMQHYATSCLGCHDSQSAAAHAYTMTATFPSGTTAEACATCHGPDAQFSVDKMHAR